jgi:hypothetical protein
METRYARIYARGEMSFAKFLFLPSWFVKLLEDNFSHFAKIRWMPSWFAKLLELLLYFLTHGTIVCFENIWFSVAVVLMKMLNISKISTFYFERKNINFLLINIAIFALYLHFTTSFSTQIWKDTRLKYCCSYCPIKGNYFWPFVVLPIISEDWPF